MRTQITPFTPTLADQDLITLLNAYGCGSWDDRPLLIVGVDRTIDRDNLKDRIAIYLKAAQCGFCAYCANDPDDHRDIDHFAKKSSFEKLTWDVNNLLSSCVTCNRKRKLNKNFVNGFTKKAQRVTINTATQLTFNVVNPLSMRPAQHINWGTGCILCNGYYTNEGKKTIEIFELQSNKSTLARSATHILRSLQQNQAVDEALIQQIISISRTGN